MQADYKKIVAQKYRDVHQEDIDVSLKDQELENLITAMACEFDIEDSKLKAAKIFEKWMRSSHPDTIDRFVSSISIFNFVFDVFVHVPESRCN